METRRKSSEIAEFARQLILSKEFESTLRRRVSAGQISRDFARILLGYARGPDGSLPQSAWLREQATLAALQKIADGKSGH